MDSPQTSVASVNKPSARWNCPVSTLALPIFTRTGNLHCRPVYLQCLSPRMYEW